MKKSATFNTVIHKAGTSDAEITISTRSLDRDGDVLEPNGANFEHYLLNPVVCWAHQMDTLPIGVTTSLTADANGIRAKWRWLQGDEFAERVKNAFDQGVVRAASIGFTPIESEPLPGGGWRFVKYEMLEWSLVSLPANAEALRCLKRLGLDRSSIAPRMRAMSRGRSGRDVADLLRLTGDAESARRWARSYFDGAVDLTAAILAKALQPTIENEIKQGKVPGVRMDPFDR